MNHYIYGVHAALSVIMHRPESIKKIFLLDKRQENHRLQDLLEKAHLHKITIELTTYKVLDQMVQHDQHQGVILLCAPLLPLNETHLFKILEGLKVPPFLLILDGIKDPHNLGACMRTADAAGVQAVIVPKDRAVSLTATVCKVASGAVETLPLIQVTNLASVLRALKEKGIWLYGMSGEAQKSLYASALKGPIALLLGEEEKGLRHLTLSLCDELLSIPMLGSVTSLNVSVATGICLFEAIRQRE